MLRISHLTWDKYNSLEIHFSYAGCMYFASLLDENRNWIMCISILQTQSSLSLQNTFPFPIKSKLSLRVPFGRTHQTVVSVTSLVPTYVRISTPCSLHVSDSYMCGALTTTALWWAPRPALLGCSPQPDARLPLCPSYCGGPFQCTPSPGPRTRWTAELHKYFLSQSSCTE